MFLVVHKDEESHSPENGGKDENDNESDETSTKS